MDNQIFENIKRQIENSISYYKYDGSIHTDFGKDTGEFMSIVNHEFSQGHITMTEVQELRSLIARAEQEKRRRQ